MAEQEEDFSSLPLPDRFAHKNWKVRKEGYEAAAKDFDKAQGENDPVVREFILDPSIWKAAVADSNVAAQQEALAALCAFLQIAGTQGCTRTRNLTIVPIVEKGLSSARPAARQKALEALLLYVELDRADPVIEELLPLLSHKQPKIIAATLSALTSIYHAYGCKTVEPKPTLKVLPKVFGHADKNVRAEAQNLTVEFYRWLKDAMKPFFWGELKPVQQQDLEKLFDKVKDEPPPKQERLLRSQQAVEETSGGAEVSEVDGEAEDEEEAVIDLEPEFEAVNVMAKVPQDLHERLASSKWKDRKDALDDLHTAINHPKIEEGQFHEIMSALAKCMKDANIAVVSVAANCVELFAKGLRKGFAKYRSSVTGPMMERLKEKKQSVTDAISAALDAVFAATSLTECLEDILEFLKHKNPQVKLESTRFLIRCLKITKEAPEPSEVKSIADVATKLLAESQEVQRSAGAEVLGTLWKIMGDRIMAPHLEGLDEIRKTKIKECFEAAEVKAKYKPKAAAPPPKPAAPTQKKTPSKKPPAGSKRAAPAPARASSPLLEEPPAAAPLAARPTTRPGVSKPGAPKTSSLAPPASGLRSQQKRPGSSLASPRKPAAAATTPDEPIPSAAKPRSLANRPLGKPAPTPPSISPDPAPPASSYSSSSSMLSSIERAELEALRAENERLRAQTSELQATKSRLATQVFELQNQNAQLIEDHTRDVLSVKAKETQLVRARGDAESAEERVREVERDLERLRRDVTAGRVGGRGRSPGRADGAAGAEIYADGVNGNGSERSSSSASAGVNGRYDSGFASATASAAALNRGRSYMAGAAEGKENLPGLDPAGRTRLSPGPGVGASAARGGSPAAKAARGPGAEAGAPALGRSQSGAESWKRAAEVTQNLKARIELMKAKQGLARQ